MHKQDVSKEIGKAIGQAFVKTWLLIIEDDYIAGVDIEHPAYNLSDGVESIDYRGQAEAKFWQIDEATQRYSIVVAYLPIAEAKRQKHSATGEEFSYGDGYIAFAHVAKWLPPFEYELTYHGESLATYRKWQNAMCFSSNHTTHIDYHLAFAIRQAKDVLAFAALSDNSMSLLQSLTQLAKLKNEFNDLDKDSDDASMIMNEMLYDVEGILGDVLPDVLIAGPIEDDNCWGIYPNLDEYPLLADYI